MDSMFLVIRDAYWQAHQPSPDGRFQQLNMKSVGAVMTHWVKNENYHVKKHRIWK